MFKEIVLIALIVLAAWIIIFQILVPLFLGIQLFPAFKKKRRALEGELAVVKEDADLQNLQKLVNEQKPVEQPAPAAETKEV